MAFAVVTYFDAATDASVRALWQSLADRGISPVMATMGIRPHLSLAGIEILDADPLYHGLGDFAKSAAPLTVNLSAVGTFPTAQGVVYIAPVVSSELIKLHQTFHDWLADLGLTSMEYYRPENWVPHCTVAINLPPESVPEAVAVARASDVFGKAQLVEIALVEYMPVKEICVYPLHPQT
jgi:2'-5' RNA ligase